MGLTKEATRLYLHCLPADIGDEVTRGVMAKHRVNVAREANTEALRVMALLAVAKVPNLAKRLEELARERHPSPHRARPADRGARGRDCARDRDPEEAIRIPADWVTGPATRAATRPAASRPRGPRLRYLRRRLVEIGASRTPTTPATTRSQPRVVGRGPERRIPRSKKRSSTSTATATPWRALRDAWHAKTGGLIPNPGARGPWRRWTATTCAPSWGTAARRGVGPTCCSARLGRPARRRRVADRGSRILVELMPGARCAARSAPATHGRRGGHNDGGGPLTYAAACCPARRPR